MNKSLSIRNRIDKMIEDISGPSCVVMSCKDPSWLNDWFPKNRPYILYPEHGMDLKSQSLYMTNLLSGSSKALVKNVVVITRSPFIISDFHKDNVIIIKGDTLEKPFVQTFGLDYMSILTEMFDCGTMGGIAKAQMDDIIKRAESGEEITPLKEKLLRTFGTSTEKVLAFHHLKSIEDRKGSNNEQETT